MISGPSYLPKMESVRCWIILACRKNTFDPFESFLVCLAHIGHTGLRGGWSKKNFDPFLVFLARVSGASKKVFGSYLVPLARAWGRVLAGISSVTPGARLRPSPAPSPGQAGDRTYPLYRTYLLVLSGFSHAPSLLPHSGGTFLASFPLSSLNS